MSDNAALAVAATGGAAGAQDEDVPEPAITIPDVWRCHLWQGQLTRVDAALVAAFIVAVAYVVADVFPQSAQAAQTWIFMRLLLILAGIYGAFGLLCTLWNRLCYKPPTVSSPRVDLNARELKREFTERWVEQLPSEEQKKIEQDFIDPVGDGALGEFDVDITDSKSNIGEVLAHHISLEEKRAKNTQAMKVESGCPGGDVAWSTVPEKESLRQENHLEVSETLLKPVQIPQICETYFESPLPQEGLNFTDESPEDTAESNTPEDESESREPGEVQGLFADRTSSTGESESLDVGEEQGAASSEQLANEQVQTARPPSQPAGASSAYSFSLPITGERNALIDDTSLTGASNAFLGERNAVTVNQCAGAFLRRNAQTEEAVTLSSHSVSEFHIDQGGTTDEMYARILEAMALRERSVSSQTAEHVTGMGHGGHMGLACPHRHCCRNHADHGPAMDFKETHVAKADLLDESRPMPNSYFGVPRQTFDSDHSSKFQLTVIPEDDLPQTV